MVAVADRRFDDAKALCDTRENARANGAVYLAGFVVEILLKAQLLRKFEAVVRTRPDQRAEAEVHDLIWKRHDLGRMLAKLRDLEASLKRRGERDGTDYVAELKKCAEQWTVQARYSTRTIQMSEADQFLERVRRLKQVLK